jgi:tripartite tricarboxylate transporter TctB family protein
MRISGAAVFSASLAAIAAYAVITALRWPSKAALFPLVMGIPLLVLALVQMAIDWRGVGASGEAPRDTRAAAGVLAWMASFIALVFLLGFPLAVPLFIFGYLVIAGREPWLLSVALAAIAWGAFHLLFQRLLHFPFDAGLLTGGGT